MDVRARRPDPGRRPWPDGAGVVELPDGSRVRGRPRRADPVVGGLGPQHSVLIAGRRPREAGRSARWVRWPDFWLPLDPEDALDALAQAHRLARDGVRVEVTCAGGRGRTGTALACIAVLAGVPAGEAVEWVRERYDARAVETPWQARFVRRSAGVGPTTG